jgi:hypothetical protein
MKAFIYAYLQGGGVCSVSLWELLPSLWNLLVNALFCYFPVLNTAL